MLLRKAMLFDQARTTPVTVTKSGSPKIATPGSPPTATTAKAKEYKARRSALKQSGSVSDAAALLDALGIS